MDHTCTDGATGVGCKKDIVDLTREAEVVDLTCEEVMFTDSDDEHFKPG